MAHHLVEDDGAGDDGVGAPGADAVDLAALGGAVRGEEGGHVAQRAALQRVAVEAGEGVGGLALGEASERSRAAAGGDQRLACIEAGRGAGSERLGDHAAHRLELLARGRVVGQPGGAGAERAQGKAPGAHDLAGDDARHLGAAAADVDDGARADGEPVEGAHGRELRLLGAVEHLDGEAQLSVNTSEELVTVPRGADGGGGDHVDGAGPRLAGEAGELGDGIDGGGDTTLAEV